MITDPIVSRLAPMRLVLESLDANGIAYELFDRVRVEPTDDSFPDAIAFAERECLRRRSSPSAAARSSTPPRRPTSTPTYPPADFLDYVNPPIGKGLPVPGPLKPLIAIPTTAGTGSETTGVSIFDLTRLHAKTGIASRRLKPTLGLLDPDNTRTLPPRGRRVERARHPEPRRRVVHGDAVHRAAAARTARRCGPPTRDRTRSATSGRCRRCGWSIGS